MAKIQFLTILMVVTCFLGGVVSVTDKEFEVSNVQSLLFKPNAENSLQKVLKDRPIEIPYRTRTFKANYYLKLLFVHAKLESSISRNYLKFAIGTRYFFI